MYVAESLMQVSVYPFFLCVTLCVLCVTGVCGALGDFADMWKVRHWVGFEGGCAYFMAWNTLGASVSLELKGNCWWPCVFYDF